MKKILTLAFAAAVLASCSETIEDRAEALIEKDMKGTLYNPDTYDAIETRVDSAFAPDDDPQVFAILADIGRENIFLEQGTKNIEQLQEEMAKAEAGMKLCASLSDGSEKYRKYQGFRDECGVQIEKIRLMQDSVTERIGHRLADVKKVLGEQRRFVGFKAVHRYSAENQEGKRLEETFCYILDGGMKEILFTLPLEKYEMLSRSFDGIRDALSVVRTDSAGM